MNNKIVKNTILSVIVLMTAGALTGCNDDEVVKVNPTPTPEAIVPLPTKTPVVPSPTVSPLPTTEPTATPSPTTLPPVAGQKGWYIKLTVESATLKDNSTVFGYLEGASDGKDRYDSEALSSSGLYTTIYHTDFGSTKNYRSDYRTYAAAGQKSDTWTIKVNSGDANADVTLSWDGITYVTKNAKGSFNEEHKATAEELSNMRLVDVEDNLVIPVLDNGMKISFNMNGNKVRTFKWVVLKDGEVEPEVTAKVSALSAKVNTFSVEKATVHTLQEDEEENDGFTPPSFEKR
jgi:hypothetical protein